VYQCDVFNSGDGGETRLGLEKSAVSHSANLERLWQKLVAFTSASLASFGQSFCCTPGAEQTTPIILTHTHTHTLSILAPNMFV
jgi:hypothetical protein